MMNLHARSRLLFLTFALSFIGIKAGARTYSLTCENKRSDDSVNEVVCDLAKDAIVNAGHTVSENTKAPDGLIRVKALKLGETYTVTATLSKGNETVRSSKLKAENLDEIDSVVPRVVRSVTEGEDVKKDARVGEVTNDESQFRKKRIEARAEYFGGFGIAGVSNVNAKSPYYNILFGGSFDWTQFRIRAELEYSWHAGSRSGSFAELALVGNIFLTDGQIAPYVGPKIGLGYVTKSNPPKDDWVDILPTVDTNAALLTGAVVGIEFFRNHTASVGVEATLDYVWEKVIDAGYPFFAGIRLIITAQ